MIPIPEDAAREAMEIASSLPGGLRALVAYGSQVAGYASPESDYDLIAVTGGGAARYRYVRGSGGGGMHFYFSILSVGIDRLRADAERGALGEFVAGRFLNPYQVLVGEEVVERAAAAYRRRVVMEELARLAAIYGQFAPELLMPPEYFLFSKLRRRARIYPPARYSYVRTYSGPEGRRNLEFSASRMREALDSLAAEGIVEAVDADGVGGRTLYRALRPPTPRRPPELETLSLAVRQYAAHLSSGRVSPRVFLEELSSKARRSRAAGALELPELDRPSRLLSIPEGMLSSEGLNPLLEGCGGASARPLGEFYSTTRVVEASCGGRGIRIVVKDYGSPWGAKWIMVRVAAAGIREMRLTSLERLSAEYAFTRSLRAVGLSTPRILLVDPGRPLMAREYVEGVVLEKAVGEEEPFRELGRLMGRLHSIGVTLGDVKPSNFLISQPGTARIYLIDCEQAMLGGSAPWDVASFLYFLAPLGRRRGWDAVRKSATSFLDGYSSTGDVATLRSALSTRYLAPLSPLLQPGEGAAIAGVLSQFLSGLRI
ncbi:MAG: hypothetical protein ACP5HT_01070 [Conexivisphaera sp.]|jgi:tRNA A-37 threonylcarbamoyl transferase component Bud32